MIFHTLWEIYFMKHNIITIALLCITAVQVVAQKIDFNLPGKESQALEDGFQSWAIGRSTTEQTETFAALDGANVTITVAPVGEYNNGLMCDWWKDGVSKYSKLVSDVLYSVNIDEANNYTFNTNKPMGIELRIKGLTPGLHTLTAFHNNTSGSITSLPTLSVMVNGVVAQKGVAQTNRITTEFDATTSYVKFNVTDGETVTVRYVTEYDATKTYSNTSVAVNALIFDRPMPAMTAANPLPVHLDMHADCDEGHARLQWTPGTDAVRHHVYIGTSEAEMSQVAVTSETSFLLTNPSALQTYFWRIDEETADGTISEGDVWSFRPRHLAFPGAEGYGRFAIGGRGGTVYHVTSLDDDVDNPQPGTLRYGIRNVHGPRTIVFDVSGYITLKGRLTCSDKYVTIAGQTAPGKGIILRGAPFGMASDGITRFIRNRRGFAATEADQDKGLDGLGMAGNDHSIMDHCSVSWTIDEAFSSRNAKNITLQRTLISEALNIANHPNYSSGTKHGYAATIGGDTGSYHHNLLAHCEGRNWSLSGGLDGGGAYAGHHDIYNNVVYNWGGRATDGGTHECNFVSNYYKKGPATSQNTLLNAQLEGTGSGSQSYYVKGNIREETNGTKTQDKQGTTYKYSTSGGQVVDWTVFADKPFFETPGTIETAEAAFHNTLCDVGCNEPVIDDHDVRMVYETYNRTTSTVGSKSGKKGLIDRESDAGGYEDFSEEHRAEDYDSDQDGMPDWWENAVGSDPLTADNNDDKDGDGYTALEDYLNWMAEPHFFVDDVAGAEIALRQYFAGYSDKATYSVSGITGAKISDGKLFVSSSSSSSLSSSSFATAMVTCSESGFSCSRPFNLYFHSQTDGITSVDNTIDEAASTPVYNTLGQKVNGVKHGILIQNGRKVIKH